MQRYVISIDVGGTFTDCVVIGEEGRTAAAKARSTPADDVRSGFFCDHDVGPSDGNLKDRLAVEQSR